MVIIPMEVDKKMHNSFFKYILFIGIIFYSSFVLPAQATNYGSGLYNSGLYSAIIPVIEILPSPGTYNSTQSVSLTAQGSSLIRYSTLLIPADCTTGNLYSSPISVPVSTRIYVRACDVYGNSSVGTYNYDIDSLSPTATVSYSITTPTNGVVIATITPNKTITVTNNGGLTVHTFTDNGTFTFEFIDNIGNTGWVTAIVNNIDTVPPAVPISSPTDGSYNSTQSVVLTSEGSNFIRYSTSSIPIDCSSGILYSSPVLVSSSLTVYTRACDVYGNSSVGTFDFIITNNILNSPLGGGGGSSFTQVAPIKETIVDNGNTCQSGELFNTKTGLSCPVNDIKIIVPNNYTNHNNSSVVLFTKNLKYKMSGPDVRLLQIYLNNHGYLISKTGPGSLGKETVYFGLSTKKAVTYFQKKNNIKADGIFGSKTRKLINSLK